MLPRAAVPGRTAKQATRSGMPNCPARSSGGGEQSAVVVGPAEPDGDPADPRIGRHREVLGREADRRVEAVQDPLRDAAQRDPTGQTRSAGAEHDQARPRCRSLTCSSPSVTERADSTRYSALGSPPMICRTRSNVSCAAVCCSSQVLLVAQERAGRPGHRGDGGDHQRRVGGARDHGAEVAGGLAPITRGETDRGCVVTLRPALRRARTTTWVTGRFGYVSRARSTTS